MARTRPLGRRNEVLVAMKAALELQETIVSAGIAKWILPAHAGSGLVHRTTPRFAVKQPAYRLVYRIPLMPQDLLVDVLRLVRIGKALARRSRGDSEMLRETPDVGVRYRDARMTAAIPRTFVAIEAHGAIISRRRAGRARNATRSRRAVCDPPTTKVHRRRIPSAGG